MRNFLKLLFMFSVSHLAYMQPCSMHKVEIICAGILNSHYAQIGTLLTCYGGASIKSTIPGASVSTVVHSNKMNVTNLPEITGLRIESASVKFIPIGIKSKLSNLKSLTIAFSGLLSVNSENLKEFGTSLEFLSLHDNSITSIDADLFQHNTNLRVVYLWGNPIRLIEPEFFTKLRNFKMIASVEFSPGNCINQDFNTQKNHHIETFKWNGEKCSDYTAKKETQNLIDKDLCYEAKVAYLMKEDKENNVQSLSEKINSFDSVIQKLIQNNEVLQAKVERSLENITRIDGILNSFIKSMETLNQKLNA